MTVRLFIDMPLARHTQILTKTHIRSELTFVDMQNPIPFMALDARHPSKGFSGENDGARTSGWAALCAGALCQGNAPGTAPVPQAPGKVA